MPPIATKGKGKGRDARRSRSRNTTPNSVISNSAVPSAPALTAYLGIDTARLLVPSSPQYVDMIEKLELKQGMPEPKHLDSLVEQLRQLSDAAEARSQACYLAMTALSDKRKEIAEQERERERLEREAESRRARMRKEAEEAEDEAVVRKAGKLKKRKDRPSVREERPMAHGAHELARQDRIEVKQEGESIILSSEMPVVQDSVIMLCWLSCLLRFYLSLSYCSSFYYISRCRTMRLAIDIRFLRRETFNDQTGRAGADHITEESEKPRAVRAISSPGPADHPSPSKRAKLSPGSSSLSEMAQSPDATVAANDKPSPKKAASAADTSDDERQPPPAPPVTQHAFFPDPLGPDPVIYHIREVTPGMTDEEKKEIYSVTGFPTKDLSDQIAGSPPDKDFSNAKPTNQVAANTFLSYVEPYVRPLTEEDIAFLRERVG
jgi:transcriptional adapter 3